MIELRADPAQPAAVLKHLPDIAWRYPGPHHISLLVGKRRLSYGEDYAVDGTPECLAALSEFGDPVVVEC